MATERPFRHLSQADLDDMIKAEMMKGARKTSPAVSGLVKSDYVSPEGRSGLMRTETPDETSWRDMQVEKRDIAKTAERQGAYRSAMDAADKKFQESTAFNTKWGNQDRLEREFRGIEQKLKGYQGIPSGLRDITDYGDDTPDALQRQKFSILNALMGKEIDVGKAFPERKAKEKADDMITLPDGSMMQRDKDGRWHEVRKAPKEKKPQPTYWEKKQIDQLVQLTQDPVTDPETRAKAQAQLNEIIGRYGGGLLTPGPGLGGEEPGYLEAMVGGVSQKERRSLAGNQTTGGQVPYADMRDDAVSRISRLVQANHPKAKEAIAAYRQMFPEREDALILEGSLTPQEDTASSEQVKKIISGLSAKKPKGLSKAERERLERRANRYGEIRTPSDIPYVPYDLGLTPTGELPLRDWSTPKRKSTWEKRREGRQGQ